MFGTWYYLNVTLHVLAAMVWLGGMFFFALVGAPVLRRIEPPALRARLFQELGRRFRAVGWTAIAVLLFTGLINLHFRGLLASGVLWDRAYWSSSYGRSLAVKLASVSLMITISAWHDFVAGPRAGQLVPGSAEAVSARRWAATLARLSVLLGLIAVIAAVKLARGG